MLIINNHNNYIFIEFNEYYKFNNIIVINMSIHSSHLLQLLNVGLYLFLKFACNCQINLFIYTFFNYITKIESFIAYLIIHNAIFIKKILKKNSKMLEFHFKI